VFGIIYVLTPVAAFGLVSIPDPIEIRSFLSSEREREREGLIVKRLLVLALAFQYSNNLIRSSRMLTGVPRSGTPDM